MTSLQVADERRSSGTLYVCLPVAPMPHQSVRCVPSKKPGGKPRFYCPHEVVQYKQSIKNLLLEGLSPYLVDLSVPLIPTRASIISVNKVSLSTFNNNQHEPYDAYVCVLLERCIVGIRISSPKDSQQGS